MKKLFGTDGIRGLANVELTAKIAFEAGQAGALVLARDCENPVILIAQDTRLSCDMLVAALAAGICSVGVNVLKLGVLPTPGVAALVRKYGASAGVMVSASHNSFEDNGIKFFNREGFKLPDLVESEIEAQIAQLGEVKFPEGIGVGTISADAPAASDYAEFLADCVFNTDLSGLTIALDCANGAAFRVAPAAFEKLGAKVHIIGASPNGRNINENCGSTHMDALVDFVRQNPVDAGFAFDGDGDRCFAVDSEGNVVDGDQIMTILALQMKQRGKLAENTVITTVMANLGFMKAMEAMGIKAEQTAVGDRYVLQRMKEGGFTLGGEQSGHIILLNHQSTGDGV
ncbi:MAG: phosphoglucosamine mutase, partial [Clostridiales bacterium]|nr:phosphoglucosamine mutase [Clostridiales bacterium]